VAGYTRQQLAAAKAGVVGITSVVAGFFLGREEGDYAASMLVAAAILGTMATAYEFLSYWLASFFGGEPDTRGATTASSEPAASVDEVVLAQDEPAQQVGRGPGRAGLQRLLRARADAVEQPG